MIISFRRFNLPHLYLTNSIGYWTFVNTKINKAINITNEKFINDLNELYCDKYNYSLKSVDLEFILTMAMMGMEGII